MLLFAIRMFYLAFDATLRHSVSTITPKGNMLVSLSLFFPFKQKERSSRTSLPGGKEVEEEPSAVQEREALPKSKQNMKDKLLEFDQFKF